LLGQSRQEAEMAISQGVRPTSSGLQVSVERPSATPVRGAIATELTQAVRPAAGADATHQDPSRAAHATTNDLVLDAQSREVITRAIEWSRRVTRQVPEVAARRLKAYSRSAEDGADQTGGQTDTKL
jgi:hypothetical protein